MNRANLLQLLPPYSNRYVTIKRNQSVNDIVKEVLEAHKIFAGDYDRIAAQFDQGSNLATAKALFSFLKNNVRYDIEPEEKQTTKSPGAILTQAHGDCKHYAGFIAGVLDALKRRGRNINWFYRFASYSAFDSLPQHVFVVMKDGGNDVWIDPVLKSFNERLEPVYILDKTVNATDMLQRVSGIEDFYITDEETDLPPEVTDAIALLFSYGILNEEGQVNDGLMTDLSKSLPPEEFEQLAKARVLLHNSSISGFFSNIWRGVKKVTLAAPRNAFLSLVGINAFGLATKLQNVLFTKDGNYFTEGKAKLYQLWHDRFAGDFSKLENTIKYGAKKKAILGAAPVALPAWVTIASALIAAVTPLISSLLKKQAEAGTLPSGIDPFTGLPYGMNDSQTTGGGLIDWIKQNPAIVVGAGVVAYYFLTNKKRSA